MVAKDTTFGTSTPRKEQTARMIWLSMLQLVLEAVEMPSVTTSQFNSALILQGG